MDQAFHRRAFAALRVVCASCLLFLLPNHASGQPPTVLPYTESPGQGLQVDQRIDELEGIVFQLQKELEALKADPQPVYRLPDPMDCGPVFMPSPYVGPCNGYPCEGCGPDGFEGPSHYVVYDGGWVLRPYDVEASPYELQINLHNQFRYTGFGPSKPTFTNSAGVTVPIEDRNDFDINRGRLVFSGYAFDPKLRFYANIDYNTVSETPIQLLMSWATFAYSDAFNLHAGLGKVPGTWEWLETSRYTLGADRTMATTFFRPSMTAGVWIDGEVGEGVFYRGLIGNGFNTFSLRAGELDSNLAYSGMVWWEPLGSFGVGFSDLEYHETPVVRVGNAMTYTHNDRGSSGDPGPEQTVIRLSDGTRLVEPGAIAPGVTVNEFDISLYAIHGGVKYRGICISAEYFLRWLTALRGTGPLPIDSLFDHGYFVQGGFFVVPQRLELFSTGSYVTGDYGAGSQIGGGANWYLKGRRGSRFTLDVGYLDRSPAQQDRTGYVAGASGTLVRLQFWSFF